MPTRPIIAPVLVLLMAACDAAPGAPPTSQPPTAPSSQVTGLRVEGPPSLEPGASARYRAVASFSDLRTQDVTNESSWFAEGSQRILVVESPGMVTAIEQGEAQVTVRYPAGTRTAEGDIFGPGTLSSSTQVLVLEPGTFRVSGVVSESGLPFPGVRVAVVAGRRAGLSAGTDADGRYLLYGLVGPTELAVSEEGLETARRAILVTSDQTVDFSLQPRPGYDSLTGEWRLTLQASASCGSDIPPEAATRTVGARITQRGAQLGLELNSPARVILNDYPASGHGGVSAAGMSFRLQVSVEENPPRWVLLEMLEPRRFLGIAGYGEGQRSGHSIVGWLSGEFALYRSTGTNYLAAGTTLDSRCYRKVGIDSSLHAFRFDRN